MAEPIRKPFPEQFELEERLKAELDLAKAAYDTKTAEYQRAIQECEERRTTPLDGKRRVDTKHISVSLAAQSQHNAFDEYRRALKAFNNYAIYHELPK